MLITDKKELSRFSDENRVWQLVPSVARSRGGRLFCTFYSGAATETLGNFCILIKSDDDGESWSEPIGVAYAGELHRCFDPTLWIDPLGRLWFTWSKGHEYGVYGAICDNPDAEKISFSDEFYIGDCVMMNKPTVLSTGEWLFPIALWNFWAFEDTLKQKRPYTDIHIDEYFAGRHAYTGANVYKSSDNGKTFTLIGGCRNISERSFDEHMIYERQDGVLVMLIRTKRGIARSLSYDRGVTWTYATHCLQNPSSRFHVRRLLSGRLLLINHDNFTGRNNMTAFLSEDDGKTWPYKLLLDERDEVSYPDMAQGEDGYLYIVYDRERGGYKPSLDETMKCAREILMAKINEEDIIAGKIVSEKSYLKKIVSKLGKYTGNKDYYKDIPDIDPKELIETASKYESVDKILKTVFVYYPLNCQNMHLVDAKKTDCIIADIEKDFGDSEKVKKHLKKLVLLLSKSECNVNREEPLVKGLTEYLQSNVSAEIDVKNYAEKQHVSVYYLCHLFKKTAGISIYEYRNACRFAEAKKLLASSDMKIVDICFACGFNDASYFAKKFKFSEGISPSEYRKLHKRR